MTGTVFVKFGDLITFQTTLTLAWRNNAILWYIKNYLLVDDK